NDRRRLRVPEQRLELVRLVRGIDRMKHETRAEAREIEAKVLRRFLDLNRDAVPGLDAGISKARRDSCRHPIDVTVRVGRAVARREQLFVRMRGERAMKVPEEISTGRAHRCVER